MPKKTMLENGNQQPAISWTLRRRASGARARAILLSLATLASTRIPAGDWLQFRGPAGRSVARETGLPSSLEPERHTRWKAALPGRGLSSPIVLGDRVYVTCSSGPEQQWLHVLCLRTDDGSVLWERRFWATGRTMTHEKTCVAAPTPASDGERLYVMYSSNDVVCLDLEGNVVWLRGLTLDYPNASNSLGMAASPVVVGDVLVVQVENDTDSFAAGLDARTGVNRWRKPRPKMANWTSPQLMRDRRGDRTLVILQSSGGIDAVDPATGQTAWSYQDGADTIASSVATDDVLYVPSHGLTALRPEANGSPRQAWRSSQLRPATASPVYLEGKVYVLNSAGVLNCASAEDGSRVWQLRLEGPFSATPVAAGAFLYCVNEKGLLQVVDCAKPEGAVASRVALGQTVLGTPSIAHGALYVRSDQSLWKLGNP